MNSCLKLIEDVYRITDFHEYIFRGNKYAFIAHLIIWLTLVEQKSEEIVSRKQLQWLIDSGNVTVIERIPFRSLELRYFLDFGNFSHHLPSEQELFKQTILGDKFELISLTDADIYSITHTIFYLTDFGFKHSHLLESSHNSILEILQNLIGIMLSAKHWDLVAELILAYRCLTTKENFWITLAWKALYSVQTSLGMIYKDNQQDTLETTNLSSKLFRGYYHRTLVTVMASLLGKIK